MSRAVASLINWNAMWAFARELIFGAAIAIVIVWVDNFFNLILVLVGFDDWRCVVIVFAFCVAFTIQFAKWISGFSFSNKAKLIEKLTEKAVEGGEIEDKNKQIKDEIKDYTKANEIVMTNHFPFDQVQQLKSNLPSKFVIENSFKLIVWSPNLW